MNEINNMELERLAGIGSTDGGNQADPRSIATTIAASILYCTSPVVMSIIQSISAISTVVSAVSTVAGCGKSN